MIEFLSDVETLLSKTDECMISKQSVVLNRFHDCGIPDLDTIFVHIKKSRSSNTIIALAPNLGHVFALKLLGEA